MRLGVTPILPLHVSPKVSIAAEFFIYSLPTHILKATRSNGGPLFARRTRRLLSSLRLAVQLLEETEVTPEVDEVAVVGEVVVQAVGVLQADAVLHVEATVTVHPVMHILLVPLLLLSPRLMARQHMRKFRIPRGMLATQVVNLVKL